MSAVTHKGEKMTPKRTAEVTKARYFADEDEAQAKTATNELDITVEDGAKAPADNKQHKSDIPAIIPILPLRGVVVYPQTAVPLTVGQPRSIKLVDEVVGGDKLVGLVAAVNPELESPGPNDLYRVGTVAVVHRLLRAPDGTLRLLVQGMDRFRLGEFVGEEPYLRAKIELAPEVVEEGLEIDALARNARDQFQQITQLIPSFPEELAGSITSVEDPLQTAYTI